MALHRTAAHSAAMCQDTACVHCEEVQAAARACFKDIATSLLRAALLYDTQPQRPLRRLSALEGRNKQQPPASLPGRLNAGASLPTQSRCRVCKAITAQPTLHTNCIYQQTGLHESATTLLLSSALWKEEILIAGTSCRVICSLRSCQCNPNTYQAMRILSKVHWQFIQIQAEEDAVPPHVEPAMPGTRGCCQHTHYIVTGCTSNLACLGSQ